MVENGGRTVKKLAIGGIISVSISMALGAGTYQQQVASGLRSQAISTISTFLSDIGLPLSTSQPVIAIHPTVADKKGISVSFVNDYTFDLDHKGRRVLSFINDRLLMRQLGRSRAKQFAPPTSAAQADDWISNWRRQLNIGKEYLIAKKEVEPDNGPHTDSNRTGFVFVAFRKLISGRPCFNFGPTIMIQMDARDGQILTYDASPGPASVSGVLTIDASHATRLADSIASRFGFRDRAPELTLGYAVANGAFGSSDNTSALMARLAWRAWYPRGDVWIDAETGNSIGGLQWKNARKLQPQAHPKGVRFK
jgi:hypothetical protein